MNWLHHAACRKTPVSVFYPREDEDPLPQAVLLCANCPVRAQCLDRALEEDDLLFGFVGGMTPRERRRENRRRVEAERRTRQQLQRERAS